jgi:hypothetical protein
MAGLISAKIPSPAERLVPPFLIFFRNASEIAPYHNKIGHGMQRFVIPLSKLEWLFHHLSYILIILGFQNWFAKYYVVKRAIFLCLYQARWKLATALFGAFNKSVTSYLTLTLIESKHGKHPKPCGEWITCIRDRANLQCVHNLLQFQASIQYFVTQLLKNEEEDHTVHTINCVHFSCCWY